LIELAVKVGTQEEKNLTSQINCVVEMFFEFFPFIWRGDPYAAGALTSVQITSCGSYEGASKVKVVLQGSPRKIMIMSVIIGLSQNTSFFPNAV